MRVVVVVVVVIIVVERHWNLCLKESCSWARAREKIFSLVHSVPSSNMFSSFLLTITPSLSISRFLPVSLLLYENFMLLSFCRILPSSRLSYTPPSSSLYSFFTLFNSPPLSTPPISSRFPPSPPLPSPPFPYLFSPIPVLIFQFISPSSMYPEQAQGRH